MFLAGKSMVALVSIDRSDGRVMVLASGILDAPAVKSADGSWSKGTFSADDLKDNFERVLDPKEVAYFLKEAKEALEM